ncbi:MAG: endolytic transglycosylase MltG [Bdellovibrionaceae bacterium]|nr:endolytic transglycosylase MltG [Pseudobdellovibrionaceae bacterium]
MRKVTRITVVALLSFVIACVGSVAYIAYDFTSKPSSSSDAEVIFEVLPAQSFNVIAKKLQDLGLIRNAVVFSLYARATNQRSLLKRGEYLLRMNMLPKEVLSVITSGKSISKPFTVAEGLNIYEISDLYERQGFGKKEDFLELVKNKQLIKQLLGEEAPSLEGYLFPETYMITKFEDTKDLISSMVRRFFVVYNELGVEAALPDWKRSQIVTLASIIEKETGAPEDRPLVSSVFHNRLRKKMKLQTDPTIIYGIADVTGVVPNNIRKDDILKPTKYNTYVIDGLPPGPISNPGKDALKATFKPAPSNYLYFVSRNDGTTTFSESLGNHNRAVQKYQLTVSEREGKSWRDKNKKSVSK